MITGLTILLLIAILTFVIVGTSIELPGTKTKKPRSKSTITPPDEIARLAIFMATGLLALVLLFPGPMLGVSTAFRLISLLVLSGVDVVFITYGVMHGEHDGGFQ